MCLLICRVQNRTFKFLVYCFSPNKSATAGENVNINHHGCIFVDIKKYDHLEALSLTDKNSLCQAVMGLKQKNVEFLNNKMWPFRIT